MPRHGFAGEQTGLGEEGRTRQIDRVGGRVDYADLVSSSFVEESLQGLGGDRISIRRSLVTAGEHPVAI